MMNLWDRIVKMAALVGGAIAGIFGEWTTLLTVLAIAMALDYISGVMVAAIGRSQHSEGGRLSSAAGFIGLCKKATIIIVVLLATALDKAVAGPAMVFQTATASFYLCNEGLSILENAALIGLPVPDAIRRALEQLRKKDDPGSDPKE